MNSPGQGANRAEMMMERLEKEQEMMKALLPATVPHVSIKNWVTKQMVCVRFVDKIGHKKQKEKRVVCLTPTTLFLCHVVGEVRRFIKLSQVESAVMSHTVLGEQLLIKCSAPEHDVLINFIQDSRNDPKERPMTFVSKLEKIKNLRGEFFPVDKRKGDLFPLANLTKHPKYIPPKKRMDKARHRPENDTYYYDEFDRDAAVYIQSLGERAGRMGATERPPPPTRTTFMTNAQPAIQESTFQGMSSPVPRLTASSPPVHVAPAAPYTTGPNSFDQRSQYHRHQEVPGYNTNTTPSYDYASPHHGGKELPNTYQSPQGGYSNGNGNGATNQGYRGTGNTPTPLPASYYERRDPQFAGYATNGGGASFNGPARYHTGGNTGNGGGGVYYGGAGPGGEAPRLHFHATSIPTAMEDMRRWEQRNQAADAVGAPRPEDLGWVSGKRSPKPVNVMRDDGWDGVQ